MYSTLSYLTRKANFQLVNPDFPITQTIPTSDPQDVFEGESRGSARGEGQRLMRARCPANGKELVADFLRKAKQLEHLISVLPSPPDEAETDLEELEREMASVNEEYLEALGVAGEDHCRARTQYAR